MSGSRESIIRDVARTLFVCAWADGVERGEINGEGPGAGGDWADAAPETLVPCPECGGRGRFGASGLPPLPGTPAAERDPGPLVICSACHGRGDVVGSDPAAEVEARRIVGEFDAAAFRGPPARVAYASPGMPTLSPVEMARRIHAKESETGRFAHCLAMEALGHGVGLEDDLPPGVRLPGWIRASVPSSDFGPESLDPERYPPPPEPTPRGVEHDADGRLPSFAWPGGYPIRYLTADGAELCAGCANGDNGSEASCSVAADAQWRIVAGGVAWEGPAEPCAHCGEAMETAYGDPDAPEAAP